MTAIQHSVRLVVVSVSPKVYSRNSDAVVDRAYHRTTLPFASI